MTFKTMTDAVRRREALRLPRDTGRLQPAAAGLRLTWHPAPDGRGLVGQWSEEPGPWFAPASFRAWRPAPRLRRRAAVGAMRLPVLTRLAAA